MRRQRKATSRPKFYLFDLGVASSLLGRNALPEKSDAHGKAFEHFITLELRAYLSYRRKMEKLHFWRSQSKFEVDFVLGDSLAIEVKATSAVSERNLKGLRALQEEQPIAQSLVVSKESERRVVDGITIFPWQEFLSELWADRLT